MKSGNVDLNFLTFSKTPKPCIQIAYTDLSVSFKSGKRTSFSIVEKIFHKRSFSSKTLMQVPVIHLFS
jgi:hypothetical protein